MEKMKFKTNMVGNLEMKMGQQDQFEVGSVHTAEQFRKKNGVYRKIKEVEGKNVVTVTGLTALILVAFNASSAIYNLSSRTGWLIVPTENANIPTEDISDLTEWECVDYTETYRQLWVLNKIREGVFSNADNRAGITMNKNAILFGSALIFGSNSGMSYKLDTTYTNVFCIAKWDESIQYRIGDNIKITIAVTGSAS